MRMRPKRLQSRRAGSVKPGAQAPGKAISKILMSPEGAAADRRISSCCRPFRAWEVLGIPFSWGLRPRLYAVVPSGLEPCRQSLFRIFPQPRIKRFLSQASIPSPEDGRLLAQGVNPGKSGNPQWIPPCQGRQNVTLGRVQKRGLGIVPQGSRPGLGVCRPTSSKTRTDRTDRTDIGMCYQVCHQTAPEEGRRLGCQTR